MMRAPRFFSYLVTVVAAVTLLAQAPVDASLRPVADVPMIDQRGIPFTFHSLPAQTVAVTFVASRCADSCPLTNALYARLARRLAGSGRSLSLVTLTLDPQFDTPKVMARIARNYGADPLIWRVAGGSPANVRRLMHAFGVVVQHDAMGMPDAHSSAVYILDAQRRLTATLPLAMTLPDDVLAATGRQ